MFRTFLTLLELLKPSKGCACWGLVRICSFLLYSSVFIRLDASGLGSDGLGFWDLGSGAEIVRVS